MSIQVTLPKFEGPLGLLLYLIRKEEMDIFDINVHEITKQYLEFIRLMKELDLEVAGEFVSMAATLIHIKSRLLLPQYNEQGEVVETEDPRKELVQRLLEYQKYQEASKTLYEKPLLGRDVWNRGNPENFNKDDDTISIEDNALYALISVYRKVMQSLKKKVHKVAIKTQSIAERILELKDQLLMGKRILMSQLVNTVENKKSQVLITFLSLLELGKLGFVTIFQADTYGEIFIDPKREIENDAISRVSEYDSEHAAEIASQLVDVKPLELDEEDEEEVLPANVVAATDEEIAEAEQVMPLVIPAVEEPT